MKRIVSGIAAIALVVSVVFILKGPRSAPPVEIPDSGKIDGLSIAFEDLQFQEMMVRDRLQKFEAAARSVTTAEWRRVPWYWRAAAGHDPVTHVIFATQWCLQSRESSYCVCVPAEAPCHLIDLIASPRDSKVGQPKQISSWTLIVRKYPPENGWGLSLRYSENWHNGQQVQEGFWVELHRTRWSPGVTYTPTLVLPCNNYELVKRFGAVEYVFSANLEKPLPQLRTARAYMESPARLSQTILESQDKLESLVGEWIESGKVTRVLDHDLLVSAPPTRNPPEWGPPLPTVFESSIPAKYELTASQKEELREQMTAELGERRRLAREHADEILQAIEAAFPLGKLLDELDTDRPRPEQ